MCAARARARSSKAAAAALANKGREPLCGDKVPFGLRWSRATAEQTCFVLDSPTIAGCSKVAAFDIDWTICRTKSGKRFPQSREDWAFWHSSVPQRLQDAQKAGFKIVFFSNQGGIGKKKQDPHDFTGKILDLVEIVGLPIQVFAATKMDHCRKPGVSMWDIFASQCNDGVQVDLAASYFVGDAAGRIRSGKGAKNDFSASDRKFAFNIGVPFLTPEEFFFRQDPPLKWEWGGIDPEEALEALCSNTDTGAAVEPEAQAAALAVSLAQLPAPAAELVILVGSPASGKTTFAKKHFLPHGYVWVNRDTQKATPKKSVALAKAALESGTSVIVDNTNPTRVGRQAYVALAKELQCAVRCFLLATPRDVADHLNRLRENMTSGGTRVVPRVAIAVYFKRYEAPDQEAEGFTEVVTVPFCAAFDSEEHRRLFLQRT